MYELKNILSNSTKPVYVHLTDNESAKQFLADAEKQGFVFSDGSKPTEKHLSDFFVLHPDFTMNYIGSAGRIAYQCSAGNITKLEY